MIPLESRPLSPTARLIVNFLATATEPKTLLEIATATGASMHYLIKRSRQLVRSELISQQKIDGRIHYFVGPKPEVAS
jgi:N-acetyl-anhydromuramyl-L-alanine amidase AmpD